MGFDLQYTQKSLPERVGSTGPMQVDTGRHEIVRNIASGGENLSSAMVILNRLQAENQLAESTALMQEEFDRLENRIQTTADTTQYDQFLKETLETSRTYSPKNRLARRMYGRVMRQAEVSGKNYVMDQKLEVEREKKRAIVFSQIASGNYGAAISALSRGVQDRSFGADEAAKLTGEIMQFQQQAQLKSQISTVTQIALTKPTKDESLDTVRDLGLRAGWPSSAITFVEGLVRDDWNREDEKRQEYQNEVQHNIIAKIRGGDKTVIDDIEKLSDPATKDKWYKAYDESTKGDLPGNPIIMGRLKKEARLIARGAVKPTDFESDLLAEFQKGSLGRGEKAGRNYDEILTLAQTKYESWQDTAIEGSSKTAYNILEVGKAENIWMELMARSAAGQPAGPDEIGQKAKQRVLKAYAYDRWFQDMTSWLSGNPMADSNQIREAGTSIANDWAKVSLAELEAMMGGPQSYDTYLKILDAEKADTQKEAKRIIEQELQNKGWTDERIYSELQTNMNRIKNAQKPKSRPSPIEQLDQWMNTQSNIDSMPADLVVDLQGAMRAVGEGKNRKMVFQKILEKYNNQEYLKKHTRKEQISLREFFAQLIDPIVK